MIISASRRTDVPACYSEWFFNRLQAGFVLVRNPWNPRQVSKISLSPEVVDGFVFWTKNPRPMLPRLKELHAYPYYFQFTLTPYGRDVEPGLPEKQEVLLPAFRQLSAAVGKERVVWRYDPVFLSNAYTMEYHRKAFADMARQLAGFTETCTVSFLDLYRDTPGKIRPWGITPPDARQQRELLAQFAQTARQAGMVLDTCAEPETGQALGVPQAHCIDRARLARIGGIPLSVERDKHQRPGCGCAASVDIGAYQTCPHGCVYCYATKRVLTAQEHYQQHDPHSPLLFGRLGPQDRVQERRMMSHRVTQTNFLGEG